MSVKLKKSSPMRMCEKTPFCGNTLGHGARGKYILDLTLEAGRRVDESKWARDAADGQDTRRIGQ